MYILAIAVFIGLTTIFCTIPLLTHGPCGQSVLMSPRVSLPVPLPKPWSLQCTFSLSARAAAPGGVRCTAAWADPPRAGRHGTARRPQVAPPQPWGGADGSRTPRRGAGHRPQPVPWGPCQAASRWETVNTWQICYDASGWTNRSYLANPTQLLQGEQTVDSYLADLSKLLQKAWQILLSCFRMLGRSL